MMEKQGQIISAKSRAAEYAIAAAMVMLAVGIFIFFLITGNGINYYKEIIVLVGLLFAMTLYLACCLNGNDDTYQGPSLRTVSVLLYLNILLAGIFDEIMVSKDLQTASFLLLTVTDVISAIIHLLIWQYQCRSLSHNSISRVLNKVIYSIGFAYIILLAINLFTHFMFFVDAASGMIVYTGLGEILEPAIITSFYVIYLLYILPQRCSWKKRIILASFAGFPLICVAITLLWYQLGIAVNELTASYIFLLLGTYVVFFGDYTDSKERMLRQQKEMAEIKSELMLSQLNPHYIANTLNSIVALCRFDPPEAERATRLFARYLRENYVDMAGSQMIPFDRELQNLKNFISIEQIRFPHLQVEYAIDCTQFMIPAMTLQPLVENAITHGVHGNGRIAISASETADDYVVCVADHGAGFTETPDDGGTHLGIRNCRERLQTLCGGNLNLSNPESGGAKCEIIIPKGGRR